MTDCLDLSVRIQGGGTDPLEKRGQRLSVCLALSPANLQPLVAGGCVPFLVPRSTRKKKSKGSKDEKSAPSHGSGREGGRGTRPARPLPRAAPSCPDALLFPSSRAAGRGR